MARQAAEVAAWVAAEGSDGDSATVECVDGRWVVLVLQACTPEVLWVLPGHYLVLDRRLPPRWRTYGREAFGQLFVVAVRDLPIFNDGEVA